MARYAIRRDFVSPGLMALTASQLAMFACQREGAGIMIKIDILPAGRYVACGADRPKFAIMLIILSVAGKTIPGCSLEDAILVAG